MFLAKAVYDNVAETPDELAFRHGEVLTVIEQDPNNLEGWWLCSLRGKRGIVPANRLSPLAGVLDPGGGNNVRVDEGVRDVNRKGREASIIYDNAVPSSSPLNWKRRSWLHDPNKVGTFTSLLSSL